MTNIMTKDALKIITVSVFLLCTTGLHAQETPQVTENVESVESAESSESATNSENGDRLPPFDSEFISREEGIFVDETDNSADNLNSQMRGDPCPEPRAAYSETPNDLKLIQEDITRFSLCVQRAQLLERLNSLAVENTETINSVLESSIEDIASSYTPPMPDIGNMGDMGAPPLPDNMAPEQEEMPAPAPAQTSWKIQNIAGQGGVLKAVLVNGQNNKVNVAKGDSLPGNNGKVVSVTATNVEISRNGQNIDLMWE